MCKVDWVKSCWYTVGISRRTLNSFSHFHRMISFLNGNSSQPGQPFQHTWHLGHCFFSADILFNSKLKWRHVFRWFLPKFLWILINFFFYKFLKSLLVSYAFLHVSLILLCTCFLFDGCRVPMPILAHWNTMKVTCNF